MKSLADLAKLRGNTPSQETAAQPEGAWTPEDEQAFEDFCSAANIPRQSENGQQLKEAMIQAYYFHDATIRISGIMQGHDNARFSSTAATKSFLERAERRRNELGSAAPTAYVRAQIAQDPVLKSLPVEEICKIIGFPLTDSHVPLVCRLLRNAEKTKEGFDELMSFLKKTDKWNFNRTKSPVKETLDTWRKRYGIPMQN